MMSAGRSASKRNTRGLPLGMPRYLAGEERCAWYRGQARTRPAVRPTTKFARRVASSFRQQAVAGFEILYSPSRFMLALTERRLLASGALHD